MATQYANIETRSPRCIGRFQYWQDCQGCSGFMVVTLLCRDAFGVLAAALNLPGTAPHQRVQPMTTRAAATAGTAPNAPLARHQRRPHQHAQLARLHRADKRWRVKQEGRDMAGQKLWLPRNPHAGADGRVIARLTGISALGLGVHERLSSNARR